MNIKILKRNTKRKRKPNTKMEAQTNIKTNIKTETRKNERRKRYRTVPSGGTKRIKVYFYFDYFRSGNESNFAVSTLGLGNKKVCTRPHKGWQAVLWLLPSPWLLCSVF